MKLIALWVFAAVTACTFSANPAFAKEDKAAASTEALKNALGASSAQGLILSYFAVNSLGDAFVKKAYDKAEALQVLAVYASTTASVTESLKSLPDKAELSDTDADYIDNIVKAYRAITKQIESLKEYIETGDEEHAKKFEENRQKAKKLMDFIFKDSDSDSSSSDKES